MHWMLQHSASVWLAHPVQLLAVLLCETHPELGPHPGWILSLTQHNQRPQSSSQGSLAFLQVYHNASLWGPLSCPAQTSSDWPTVSPSAQTLSMMQDSVLCFIFPRVPITVTQSEVTLLKYHSRSNMTSLKAIIQSLPVPSWKKIHDLILKILKFDFERKESWFTCELDSHRMKQDFCRGLTNWESVVKAGETDLGVEEVMFYPSGLVNEA